MTGSLYVILEGRVKVPGVAILRRIGNRKSRIHRI